MPRRRQNHLTTRPPAPFSFLELTVAIVIMAIMAAVAMPRLAEFFQNTKLQSAARQLSAFLNFSRQQAMIERRACRVVLDRDENLVRRLVQRDPVAAPADFVAATGNFASWQAPPGITLASSQEGGGALSPNGNDQETVFTLTNTDGNRLQVKIMAGSGRPRILGE